MWKKALLQLEAAGFEAYIVGGRVRNSLLGLTEDPESPWDVDITTNARPTQVKAVFSDYPIIETGIKHGTVTVLTPEPVEITTFRKDGTYSDGRHPDSVDFRTSINEDLSRRDFTVNAIALDVRGKIIDPFGGISDINNGILKTVGNADERIKEDPLRIFRGLRFAAVLHNAGSHGAFEIHEDTAKAMFENRMLLKSVSSERLYTEFSKLIMGDFAGDVIRKHTEIFGVVIPHLTAMKGFNQHNPYHRYDVLEHCVRAMEYIKNDYCLKLAALFHDVGKPETFFLDDDGIGHMYGHPAAGERIFRSIMNGLKADRATTDKVAALIKYHDIVFQKDKALLKRWMNRYTPETLLDILSIKEADNLATGNAGSDLIDKFHEIRCMIHEILDENECFTLKNLAVSGKDLIEKGMTPGPELGETLDKLLELVIEGRVENNRDALLKAISRF